jgi:class 3 adenylate cyclase
MDSPKSIIVHDLQKYKSVEAALLDHTSSMKSSNDDSRIMFYHQVTNKYAVNAVAIVFILDVSHVPTYTGKDGNDVKNDDDDAENDGDGDGDGDGSKNNKNDVENDDVHSSASNNSSSNEHGLTPREKLECIQKARRIFENEILAQHPNLCVIKYEHERIYTICYSNEDYRKIKKAHNGRFSGKNSSAGDGDSTNTTTNYLNNDEKKQKYEQEYLSPKSIYHIAMKAMIHTHDVLQPISQQQEEFSFLTSKKVMLKVRSGCSKGFIFVIQNNDYFGTAVNIASKLADNVAKSGEMLLSFPTISESKNGQKVFYDIYLKTYKGASFTQKITSIIGGGVQLQYYVMNKKQKWAMKNWMGSKKKQSTQKIDDGDDLNELKCVENTILIQSDLSGFTRLSLKYDILHFLTLILQSRKIFKDHITTCGESGKILNFEGDNITCQFDKSDEAMQFVVKVKQDIEKYNESKERDDQIRIQFGIAKGMILTSNDGDIIGQPWEESFVLAEEATKHGDILVTNKVMEELNHTQQYHFEKRPEKHYVPHHYSTTF